MEIESFKLNSNKCPICGEVLDAATGIQGKKVAPKEDDFTMCIYCGTLLRFNSDLSYRAAADEELLAEGVSLEEVAILVSIREKIKRVTA